jgi:hypothetical protein
MKRLSDYPTETLQAARETVADWWAANAREIRETDPYAPHVTEEQKDQLLADSLANAEKIRRGELDNNFTIWQRINLALTGECVALLP